MSENKKPEAPLEPRELSLEEMDSIAGGAKESQEKRSSEEKQK